MEIIETSVFTGQIRELLTDDEYAVMQLALIRRPDQGALVPGGGGIRKMRWGQSGRGKRGGIRVIYLLAGGEKPDLHVARLRQDRKGQSDAGAAENIAPAGERGVAGWIRHCLTI